MSIQEFIDRKVHLELFVKVRHTGATTKTTCASMDIMHEGQVTIQPLSPAWYQHKVAALDMLRLDLVHPIVSGNKWYKLRLNIMYAVGQWLQGYRHLWRRLQ